SCDHLPSPTTANFNKTQRLPQKNPWEPLSAREAVVAGPELPDCPRWRLWQKAWAYSTIESSGNNINRCALGETLESSRSCCSPAAAITIRVSPITPARPVLPPERLTGSPIVAKTPGLISCTSMGCPGSSI